MHHVSEPGGTSKRKYSLLEHIELTSPWRSSGPSLTLHVPRGRRNTTFPTAEMKTRRDTRTVPPSLTFAWS